MQTSLSFCNCRLFVLALLLSMRQFCAESVSGNKMKVNATPITLNNYAILHIKD
jgi:hypothetical protein